MHDNGIPDMTCQMYQADDFDCSRVNTCKDCSSGSCVAVKSYNVMSVGEMDNVDGDDDIMKEIMTRGPVRYSHATPRFLNYFVIRGSCGIDAEPLIPWDGKGVISGDSQEVAAAPPCVRALDGCVACTRVHACAL